MLRLRSIPGRWRNRGLVSKAGFSAGVILGGATMMAAYVGVPLRLQTADGGLHRMAASFQNRLNNPSSYSTHGQIGMANHSFAGSPANTWMESNVTGPEVTLVDGSNCQHLPPKKTNLHSLSLHQGPYRISLPSPAKNEKRTPAMPDITIEFFRVSSGCNLEPVYAVNENSTNISVYRSAAW